MTSKIITFGEIMMRLTPPGFLRFGQARSFDLIYGGGEANVAVSLAEFGLPVDYVTRLPNNDLGEACLMYLRQFGVGVSKVVRGGDRLGIYFMENGAMQRASKVIYDRANSSFASLNTGMVDWDAVFTGADWFHWTGITPAVSEGAANACLEGIQSARQKGLTVSCDLNYRKNLWKWGKKASEVMPAFVSLCDVAIGNEEDAEKVFGIKAPEVDVNAGKVEADSYLYVCNKVAEKFPNLKTIAITLRGSISASHNTWSGVLWRDGVFFTGKQFDMTHIVDRVGGGDAFAAGLVYGLLTFGEDSSKALNFAVAAACLKHSVFGDFNMTTVDEVTKLMAGEASGRVSR